MTKVLVIGLDGATWDLIKPWAEEGKLPTFKKLMTRGAWGVLESTIPPWTFPAWSSMATGKNPGNLPFFTFMVKEGYNFKPYIAVTKERERDVWDILSDDGKKVCIANLPNIYSAYAINGCMIAGWFCLHDDLLTYPTDLRSELDREIVNGYEVDIVSRWGSQRINANSDKEYLEKTIAIGEKHFKAFKYLLKNKEWDFAFVVFVDTDRILHKFWERKDLLFETYQRMDNYIAELLEIVGEDTTVFLVSDHGFGSGEQTFNINEWLIKERYLKLKDNNKANKTSSTTIKTVVVSLNKTKLMPVAKRLLNLFPSTFQEIVKKKTRPLSLGEIIDWENTKAFAYGVFGDIYLNVKGREPEGSIDSADYETVRGEIIQKFKNLKNPKLQKNISVNVFKREEIYKGIHLCEKPDLVILVDDNIQSISPSIGSNKVFVKEKGGNHRINGIFLAHGPDIKKGVKIEGAKIYDIAPTILHIFGITIPKDIDGVVLKEIYQEDSELAKRQIKYQEVNEKEGIKGRIQNLKIKGGI